MSKCPLKIPDRPGSVTKSDAFKGEVAGAVLSVALLLEGSARVAPVGGTMAGRGEVPGPLDFRVKKGLVRPVEPLELMDGRPTW